MSENKPQTEKELKIQRFTKANQLPKEESRDILSTTLPEITTSEQFKELEKDLKGALKVVQEDKDQRRETQLVTQQYVECILNIRSLNIRDIAYKNYTIKLLQDLKD